MLLYKEQAGMPAPQDSYVMLPLHLSIYVYMKKAPSLCSPESYRNEKNYYTQQE
jgi:hypothetical protein